MFHQPNDGLMVSLRTQTLEICRVWLETSGMFDEMKIPRVSSQTSVFLFQTRTEPYLTRTNPVFYPY